MQLFGYKVGDSLPSENSCYISAVSFETEKLQIMTLACIYPTSE